MYIQYIYEVLFFQTGVRKEAKLMPPAAWVAPNRPPLRCPSCSELAPTDHPCTGATTTTIYPAAVLLWKSEPFAFVWCDTTRYVTTSIGDVNKRTPRHTSSHVIISSRTVSPRGLVQAGRRTLTAVVYRRHTVCLSSLFWTRCLLYGIWTRHSTSHQSNDRNRGSSHSIVYIQ